MTSRTVFREMGDAEARALLASHHVGRLAYTFHDRVDIEPIHYAMEGHWLYGRTSIGSKLSTLAHNRWCAFEIDEVRGPFDWKSVVVKGAFELLDPETIGSSDDYDRAVKLARELLPEAFTADDPARHRTTLFRIHINELSGRAALAPETR